MNPNTQAVIEQLTPIARDLFRIYPTTGVDADDLRWHAVQEGVLTGVPSTVLPSVLTGALKAAGGKATSETRKSMSPSAKGRRVLIWRLA